MALTAYLPCNEGSGNILHETIFGHNLTRSAGDLGWSAAGGGHGSNTYAWTPQGPGYPEGQAFTWGAAVSGGPFSFATWMRRTSGLMGPILAVEQGGVHYLRNESNFMDLPGNQPVDMDVWFHLAIVVTETTYTYYINGVAGDTGAQGGFTPYLTIQLGAFSDAYIFPAYFNDMYFFDHALTQNEINRIMSGTYFWPQFTYDIYEDCEDASLASGLTLFDNYTRATIPSSTYAKSGTGSYRISLEGTGDWASYLTHGTAHDNMSFGFWYRTANMGTSQGLLAPLNFRNSDWSWVLRLTEQYNWSNQRCFSMEFGDAQYVLCEDNTWYWITGRYRRNIGGEIWIYNEAHTLLGTLSTTLRNTTAIAEAQFGQIYTSYNFAGQYIYLDDLIIDYTEYKFPLLGWNADTTYVEMAASLSGTSAVAADLTSYTRTYLDMSANLTGESNFTAATVQRLYELPANTTPADLTLDGMVYDDMSLREAIKVLLAVNAAKSTGGGTSNINFRDIKDAKNKIEAVVDAQGNRLSVTINRD